MEDRLSAKVFARTQRRSVAAIVFLPCGFPGPPQRLGSVGRLARTGSVPPYRAEDLELVEALAMRAAHAVDNARLYREAQQAVRAREETLALTVMAPPNFAARWLVPRLPEARELIDLEAGPRRLLMAASNSGNTR